MKTVQITLDEQLAEEVDRALVTTLPAGKLKEVHQALLFALGFR